MAEDPATPLRPIGTVRTTFPDSHAAPRQSRLAPRSTGRVLIEAPFRAGLEDLRNFTHLWIVGWLDRPHGRLEDPNRVRPLLCSDGRQVSLFATRCPLRPTPIAMTLAELVHLDSETGSIEVRGIDLADGTPVLDVKPYVPAFDRPQGGVPVAAGWYDDDHLEAPLLLEAARAEALAAADRCIATSTPFVAVQLLNPRGPGVRPGGELCVATETDVAGELLGGAVRRADILELARSALSDPGKGVGLLGVDTAWAADHALGLAPEVNVVAHAGLSVPPTYWEALHQARPVALAVALDEAPATTVFDPGSGDGPLADADDVRQAASEMLDLKYETRRLVEGIGPRVALETFLRTPRLVVAGWPAMGRVIADLARTVGWRTMATPTADEAVALVAELDHRDALVVLGHDPGLDEPVLTAALRSGGPGFVGALGSAHVVEDRRRRLAAAGLEPQQIARLRSPVGLPGGGKTAPEMALSIVSQLEITRYEA